MKIKIFFLLAVLTSWSEVFSQDLSIQDALQLSRSAQVDQAQIQEQLQAVNLLSARRSRLPLIYADGNINRNLIIPVTPVPSIAFDPNALPGEVTALKFATNWTAKAGVTLSLDVFNPATQSSILESQLQVEKAQINKHLAEQDKEKKIIDIYAQARLAQQQLDNAILQLDNYSSTFSILQARYEAGRLSQIELNTSQQKLLDLQALVDEAHYVYRQKLLNFTPYLDITAFDNLSTTIDELSGINNSFLSKSQSQALDVQISELKYNRLRQEILPKITLNAYIGGQFFDNDFHIFDNNYWYGNSYVNLTFRLPISESFELKTKKNIYLKQLALAQSQYEESLTQERIDQLNKKANIELIDKKIAHLNKIIQLAEDNVSLVKTQVEEGRTLTSELNTQIDNLLRRQQDLWQLQYNKIQELNK